MHPDGVNPTYIAPTVCQAVAAVLASYGALCRVYTWYCIEYCFVARSGPSG